jgi:hypothetical protein
MNHYSSLRRNLRNRPNDTDFDILPFDRLNNKLNNQLRYCF